MVAIPRAAWIAVLAIAGEVVVTNAAAHPGGVDANGCHRDRKRGDRHCHGDAPTQRTAPPIAGTAAPDQERGAAVHYPDCRAARAAGAAPVRRGDPGYAPHLDRDGDGVGCE